MNPTLDGKWSYRSFFHEPILTKDGKVEGNPDLAKPWSPPAVLEATTGLCGEVSGTLTFAPGKFLTVGGSFLPATDKTPACLELTATGLSSVNRLKGYLIPGSDHIVGTILCMENDPGKQPNGTAGPFVLFPIKE